ncbi:MAG: nucleotidyltransferase family protein [Phycisphaerae bacterium]|nr:nucleotidyltransferase family protein [Phycisphaerae bacterium]
MSRRVGHLKQLLDWAGQSVIRHATQTLLRAGLSPVIVVLGHERQRLAAEIDDLDARIIENPDYEQGMFSSVRAGLAAVPREAPCCVLALVDQPRITDDLVRRLVEYHQQHGAAVTIPRAMNRSGHPVAMARSVIDDVLAANSSSTLRDVLAKHEADTAYLDVETDAVLYDIDTWQDYERQRPR